MCEQRGHGFSLGIWGLKLCRRNTEIAWLYARVPLPGAGRVGDTGSVSGASPCAHCRVGTGSALLGLLRASSIGLGTACYCYEFSLRRKSVHDRVHLLLLATLLYSTLLLFRTTLLRLDVNVCANTGTQLGPGSSAAPNTGSVCRAQSVGNTGTLTDKTNDGIRLLYTTSVRFYTGT